MAEETVVNGGGADVDVEIASTEQVPDETTSQTIQKLMQKLSILEQEKQQLINDNQSSANKIKELEDEIQSSESDKRALGSIAARASELEIEVSRLQHDLISSMSDGQESNAELSELKRVVEDWKKNESLKSEKIDVIEKERNLLLDRLNEDNDKLKDYEDRIRELETKIEFFKSNEKSEGLKVEEETKAKINEKDEQILSLNKMIEEFQSVIVKNGAEIEKSRKEKEELEIGKNDLEALLKKSERKVNEMEEQIDQLQKELEVVENQNTNGIVVDGDEKRSNLKVDWPVAAAVAGAVTMVAVVYFRHAKF